MRIGFILNKNAFDKREWSGTKYRLFEQVSKCPNVEVICIYVKQNWVVFLYKVFLVTICKLFHKQYSTVHTSFVANNMSKSIDTKLLSTVDVIFAPSAAPYIYNLKTDKPIIYLADATFSSIYNYYPLFKNFFKFNVNQGNKIDAYALHHSSKIIASSDWSKKSMIKDYGIDPSKIFVIEFGANIDEQDIVENDHIPDKILNVLLLGVEWERKGGDIAVSCVSLLNKTGLVSNLYIVGMKAPDKYKNCDFIKSIGFLDKSKQEDKKRFTDIISKCDLLLLPTKAECSGIAFCEASAYRLPIITFDTGGIPNYVINGTNGYRLPLNAKPNDFSKIINDIVSNGELGKLRQGCISLYKSKLNWDIWRKNFIYVLNSLDIKY